MRGHIRRRGRSSYAIVLSMGYDPATGKRVQRWISVKGTRRDAERKLTELVHQLDTGQWVEPTRETTREFLLRWLRDYVEISLKPRTARLYRGAFVRHVIPVIGHVPLCDLRPTAIQEVLSRMGARGLKAATIRLTYAPLKAALKWGVRQRVLARNPADDVDAPSPERREVRVLTPGQVSTVVAAATDTFWHVPIHLAFFTGARRGEILGLRWEDVSLEQSALQIRNILQRTPGKGLELASPKTSASRRRITLVPSTIALLRQHRARQYEVQLQLGVPCDDSALVCCNPDGSAINPDSFTRAFRRTVRQAGVLPLPLHGARHTHVSLLIRAGVDIRQIAARLGHAPEVALRVYGHLLPGGDEIAAARFDQVMNGTLG